MFHPYSVQGGTATLEMPTIGMNGHGRLPDILSTPTNACLGTVPTTAGVIHPTPGGPTGYGPFGHAGFPYSLPNPTLPWQPYGFAGVGSPTQTCVPVQGIGQTFTPTPSFIHPAGNPIANTGVPFDWCGPMTNFGMPVWNTAGYPYAGLVPWPCSIPTSIPATPQNTVPYVNPITCLPTPFTPGPANIYGNPWVSPTAWGQTGCTLPVGWNQTGLPGGIPGFNTLNNVPFNVQPFGRINQAGPFGCIDSYYPATFQATTPWNVPNGYPMTPSQNGTWGVNPIWPTAINPQLVQCQGRFPYGGFANVPQYGPLGYKPFSPSTVYDACLNAPDMFGFGWPQKYNLPATIPTWATPWNFYGYPVWGLGGYGGFSGFNGPYGGPYNSVWGGVGNPYGFGPQYSSNYGYNKFPTNGRVVQGPSTYANPISAWPYGSVCCN